MTDPVSVSVDIAASPEAVYALITDLPTLASCAEETQAMTWTKGDSAAPGAVFKGSNRNGIRRWSTTSTVAQAEPGKTFAFDVKAPAGIPVARWQYDIVPSGDGCTVTESTWDNRPGWFVKPAGWVTGVPDRKTTNAENMRRTLQRLKERAES